MRRSILLIGGAMAAGVVLGRRLGGSLAAAAVFALLVGAALFYCVKRLKGRDLKKMPGGLKGLPQELVAILAAAAFAFGFARCEMPDVHFVEKYIRCVTDAAETKQIIARLSDLKLTHIVRFPAVPSVVRHGFPHARNHSLYPFRISLRGKFPYAGEIFYVPNPVFLKQSQHTCNLHV